MKITRQNRDVVLSPRDLNLKKAKDPEAEIARLIEKWPHIYGKGGSKRSVIEGMAREIGISFDEDDEADFDYRLSENGF